MDENRKIVLAIIAIYALISLIPTLPFFSSNGVLGGLHDWNMPELKSQFLDQENSRIFDAGAIPPSSLYYHIFESTLFQITGSDPALLSKILVSLFIFMSGISMFILGRALGKAHGASFLMGLAYMLSPAMFNNILAGYLFYNFAYCIAPLFLASLHLYFEKGSKKYIIIAGLIISFTLAQIQFPIMLLLIAAAYMAIRILVSKDRVNAALKIALPSLLIIGLMLVILNLYYFVPLLEFSFNVPLTNFLTAVSPSTYHEIIRAPSPASVFLMAGYPHPYDPLNIFKENILPSFPLYSIIILLSLSILSIFLSDLRKNPEIILAMVLIVISLFLITAGTGPMPSAWSYIYDNFIVMKIFRELYHLMFLFVLGYCILIGNLSSSLNKAFASNPLIRASSQLVLILLVLMAGYPILKGFMGQIQTVAYTADDRYAIESFSTDPQPYKVLFLPAMTPILHPGSKTPGWDIMSYGYNSKISGFIKYYYSLLSINDPSRLHSIDQYLERLGIRYIVCRADYVSQYPSFVPMFQQLKVLGDTSLFNGWKDTGSICANVAGSEDDVVQHGNFSFARLQDDKSYIRASSYPGLVLSTATLMTLSPFLGNGSVRVSSLPNNMTLDNMAKIPFIASGPDDLPLDVFLSNDSIPVMISSSNPPFGTGGNWGTAPWYLDESFPPEANDLPCCIAAHKGFSDNPASQNLTVALEIPSSGNYSIWLRHYIGPKGGSFDFYLGSEKSGLYTHSEEARFTWTRLPMSAYLAKGKHNLSFVNTAGLNSVDFLIVKPVHEASEKDSYLPMLLANRTFLYVIEGEYMETAGGARIYNSSSSSGGRYVSFPINGSIRTGLSLPVDDQYTLVLFGKGKVEVSLGNETRLFEFDNRSMVSSGGIKLPAGTIPIMMTASENGSSIDLAILYHDPMQRSLKDIFGSDDGQEASLSASRPNPWTWNVKANATSPFMLVIAEPYSRFLSAKVSYPSSGDVILDPIPVEGVLTGFWIDGPSKDLEITISSRTQNIYDICILISLGFSIMCAITVLYLNFTVEKEK